MNILDEAKRITSGDRNSDYGPPEDDWAAAAMLMTAILKRGGVLRDDACLSPRMAMLCMIGVKVIREAYKHKPDNLIDIAGYARLIAQVMGDETE